MAQQSHENNFSSQRSVTLYSQFFKQIIDDAEFRQYSNNERFMITNCMAVKRRCKKRKKANRD